MNGNKSDIVRKFEIRMMDNKELIYIAKGDTLEQAFLAMAKFINRKYVQGEIDNGYSVIKRRSKAI